MEAAPRFELGVKLLQSLALPLGYAALSYREPGRRSKLTPKGPTRNKFSKQIFEYFHGPNGCQWGGLKCAMAAIRGPD